MKCVGLPLVIIVALAAGANLFAADSPSLAELLPKSSGIVDLYEIQNTPRIAELTHKMLSKVDKEWMRDYIQKHANKSPLPYHTNLGLTEAEYKEYAGGSNQFWLAKVATAQISVARESNQLVVAFRESTSIQPLLFDLARNTVKTPLAQLPATEGKRSEGGLLGKRFAYDWKYSAGGTSDSRTNIQVSVGRLENTGKNFLRYQVNVDRTGTPLIRFETMFQYGMPPNP